MKRFSFASVLLSSIFFIVGFGVLFACRFFTNIWNEQVNRCTEDATGVVMDIEERMQYDNTNNNRTYTYHAMVNYSVDDNTYAEVDSFGYGRDNIPYKVGDSVTVHYNPDKPSEMYLEKADISTITTVFKVFASISIGLGILILFSMMRAGRNMQQP